MEITINLLEAASELAEQRMYEPFKSAKYSYDEFISKVMVDDNDTLTYKEGYQDEFNQWYDYYYYTLQNLGKEETGVIRWGVEDFEDRAKTFEENYAAENDMLDTPVLFNRDEFGYALEEMIRNHDCNNGITWYDVDYYLDLYCKIKE